MNIGTKVRELREKNGLRQFELAKKAKISKGYMSDIESGRTTPSIKTLMKLAIALEVSCRYLLDEKETTEKKD
jgi:transcriptional regulator with XRE-family HTH domain